ncbi:TIR domain-containing protein [Kovacikia minuta CCNUW1]|uniref:toll/interleukin-1 receptor domain-containing protein n=1 Tax=Kovacikia minuta TaxID=2931930 RepID=UPI001CCC88B2|nr:TIR domain-containing protein [Kovacikia minuta]UBF26589.1 TIR domain-containing protein [Kovacikia minuta CCNUW1]
MSHFQDAFISYGRADSKAFAKKLNDCLVAQGLEVWFDFDDIPLGVDYQNQINAGIEWADNFLFIISPHSVHSPYCAKEIDRALKLNKRIIPLMHVEQINRETWQQRHPNGTDADWETYAAKGFHTCFLNLHPEIAKINWVYFREGIDDFERSLAALLAVFERDRSYVRQHTHFLSKALEWERTHKQTRFLLVGEERQRAEEWLSFPLEDAPPCLPTDLHCEYITESTKNANNLMTQVFLSWSDKDRAFMEQLRKSLLREGFTLWISRSDIKTGADFQRMIDQGIEEADNVVYLISPDSLQSRYCQQEINYALSLNKRIIPLLICPVDLDLIPPELRELQFINFADNTNEERYQRDTARLIKVLRQDAVYHEEHKILLAKALKWERQHRNPCMLLRGYNLRHAEAWLKIARQRSQYHPIPLQEEFIQESLRQPSGVSLDVFISYSRKDSEFARRLNDALQIQGKTTWFDQESIAAGSADFQQEIYRSIESANHVLFILSPSAVNSPYCASEVEYAAQLNKRMVTVLYQPINPTHLPAALAPVQWIDFNQKGGDFDANLSVLLRTLDTDPDHLQSHTWLLVRSLEWDGKNRDESLLLRGSTLKQVREWLLESEHKSPQPTRLQRDYVTASNAAEIQRQRSALRLQRVGLGVISLISLVAIALGLTTLKQYHEANRLRLGAQREKIMAQTRSSEAMFQSDRGFDALLEAMGAGIQVQRDGVADQNLRASVLTALQQAVFWVRERQRLHGHEGIIWGVSVSPDGKRIASASADGTVKIWGWGGVLLRTLPAQDHSQMLAVTFSPDGKLLATAASNGRVTLWRLDDWAASVLTGSREPISSLAFSPNGQMLAAGSEDSTIRLWQQDKTGRFPARPFRILTRHDAAVRSVSFSPDGQLLASASDDRTVRLWQKDGSPLKTLLGHTAQVRSVSFSPDSQRLVSGSWDETIRLWRRDGTPLETIRGPETLIHDARFTPDGKAIAAAGWDKTIKLWTLDGVLMSTLSGHSGQVRQIAFNPANGRLVSVGGDRTIRIWQLRRPLLATLQDHRANVYSVAFSPDGTRLAVRGSRRYGTALGSAGKTLASPDGAPIGDLVSAL